MVTGQSLVLYSRLHLVVRDRRVLRAIFIMIIVDFCLFQVPTTVQKFIVTETNAAAWLKVFHIYERIQLLVFTIQELIISTIYIRATVTWLSPSDPEGLRRTKWFLIWLNVLCIALDIAIDIEVFRGEWVYEEATQSLAYAIKLTLEFAILNKVLEVYRFGPGSCFHCHRKLPSESASSLQRRGLAHCNHGFPSVVKKNGRAKFTMSSPWSRSKSNGSERLGPFDGGRTVITEVQAEPAGASEGVEEKGLGKGIVITTGITTCTESRDSDDNGRCDEVAPGETRTM